MGRCWLCAAGSAPERGAVVAGVDAGLDGGDDAAAVGGRCDAQPFSVGGGAAGAGAPRPDAALYPRGAG